MNPVYLDHAATTPVRSEVLEVMLPFLRESWGNPSSSHRLGRAARAGLDQARREVAEALGAEPNQVIFTSGGTEADNLAIIGASLAARDKGRPMRAVVTRSSTRRSSRPRTKSCTSAGTEEVLPVGPMEGFASRHSTGRCRGILRWCR
jgi:glutamate/tyrosine decarboxylase-like PLP-dependent enzyme